MTDPTTVATAARALADRLAAPPVPAPGTVIHPALAAGLAAAADALRAAVDRLEAGTGTVDDGAAADVAGDGDD